MFQRIPHVLYNRFEMRSTDIRVDKKPSWPKKLAGDNWVGADVSGFEVYRPLIYVLHQLRKFDSQIFKHDIRCICPTSLGAYEGPATPANFCRERLRQRSESCVVSTGSEETPDETHETVLREGSLEWFLKSPKLSGETFEETFGMFKEDMGEYLDNIKHGALRRNI